MSESNASSRLAPPRRGRRRRSWLLGLQDAQRRLLDAQDSLAQARLSGLTSTVDLAKALGGGWDGSLPPVPST